VDPAPLAQNGLTQELLQRLETAGCSAVACAASSSPGKCSASLLLLVLESVHPYGMLLCVVLHCTALNIVIKYNQNYYLKT